MFFDTHAHLDFPDFENDLPGFVERATKAGVSRIITIGTTLQSSLCAIKIAEQFPSVYAAVGWHPSYVTEAPGDVSAEFEKLASHEKVVAIGEAGLDYAHLPSTNGGTPDDDLNYKSRQKNLFEQQLRVAQKLKLNVIVHQREAFEDTLAVIEPYAADVRGVFHCYVGTPEQRERIARFGSLVSFTGIVTFKNAQTVRESLKSTPLDGFMLETDCPFLAPVPYRGKRCEPSHVVDTAKFIASEINCSLEELSQRTCQTATAFFRGLA